MKKKKRRRLEFVADTGYTLENIEKTDYIFVHLHCCFLSDLLKKLEIY